MKRQQEQSEDEKGDEGPPTDVESDQRLVIKPREEERSAGKEALRREACSLQHLMTHTPKNPFCNICNRAENDLRKRPGVMENLSILKPKSLEIMSPRIT